MVRRHGPRGPAITRTKLISPDPFVIGVFLSLDQAAETVQNTGPHGADAVSTRLFTMITRDMSLMKSEFGKK